MTENKTRIIAIIALIYLAAACGIYFTVAREVALAGKSLEERVDAIVATNSKEKVYRDLSELVEKTKTERETLAGFVLEEEETGNFLTNIERLGVEQGVVLVTNSLKVEKQKDAPDLLSVQFALEGQEQHVRKMLTIFETLPYHSNVAALTFMREPDGTTKSTIDLTVTLLKI